MKPRKIVVGVALLLLLAVLLAACSPAADPAPPTQAEAPQEAAPTEAAAQAEAPTEAAPAATEPPAAATEAPAADATLAPGELVKFSGEGFAPSDTFHLDAQANVEIAWEYTGSTQFAMWLVNDTEELTDPSLFRVLIEDAPGSTSESAQFTLEPGDYHLEVEQADGPWTVTVRSLD